jgi:hypothetical protein
LICPLQRSYYSDLELTEFKWEGDREVVKRFGRDESIPVVIHMCMKAMLVISV